MLRPDTALLALLLAALPAASVAKPAAAPAGRLKYKDFDDRVRCELIVESVCDRLMAGDRAGASEFVGDPEANDFLDMSDMLDLGRMASCRQGGLAGGAKAAKPSPHMTLLLDFESGRQQEVALRFGSLRGWTCGYIAEVGPDTHLGARGKASVTIEGLPHVPGGLTSGAAKGKRARLELGVKPEKEEPGEVSPQELYIRQVLEQIRTERERRDPSLKRKDH